MSDLTAVRPTCEEDLAEVLRTTNRSLAITGGGTRGAMSNGSPLSTAGLSGISLYEPGALTLVAQAGTPLAEVEATLAAENQRLAFEAPDMRGILGTTGDSTIGGVYASNASGPRRIVVGAARDFALGVRFVDGQGTIVKNGGRVMKNVTGYDLVKLHAGARGRLGVVTQVAFKTLPMVEVTAQLVISDLDPVHGVACLSAGLGSPFEVTGAVYLPGQRQAVLRLEGFEASVSYRAQQLRDRLQGFGLAQVTLGNEVETAWRGYRDVAPLQGLAGDLWRISVKPSDGPRVLAALGGQGLLDWGGGLVWLVLPVGTDARARIAGIPGHATLVRADAATQSRLGVLPPEDAGVATLTDGLRRQFDPKGILNSVATL